MNYEQLKNHPELNRFVHENVMGAHIHDTVYYGCPNYLLPENAELVRQKVARWDRPERMKAAKCIRLLNTGSENIEITSHDVFVVEPSDIVLAAALAMGFAEHVKQEVQG